jgi:hypothetical protein
LQVDDSTRPSGRSASCCQLKSEGARWPERNQLLEGSGDRPPPTALSAVNPTPIPTAETWRTSYHQSTVNKGAAAPRSTITADVAVFTKLKTLELNGMGLDGARGTCFRASVVQVQAVTLCTGSPRDQLCSQSQPFRSNVCSRSGRQMMLQGHHSPSSEFE